MTILVKSLFRTSRLTKKANGNNIFKAMQSKLKQTPESREFILDMKGVSFASQVVFTVIKKMMQTHFDGNFVVKIENAMPLTINAFNLAFKNQLLN